MSTVLFEPGDRVPPLELVRAERVQAGDIVWGFQHDSISTRKGFNLMAEGVELGHGAIPVRDGDGMVTVGQWPAMNGDRLLLVQVRS